MQKLKKCKCRNLIAQICKNTYYLFKMQVLFCIESLRQTDGKFLSCIMSEENTFTAFQASMIQASILSYSHYILENW